jgi:GNAT superfamily N-acetyltransferase
VTQLTHAIDRRPYGRWHAARRDHQTDQGQRQAASGARDAAPVARERALRFLGPKDHLTLAELRYLTEIDYVDHYAVVAVAADDPRELLGVGRWVRDPARPFAAELAIAVGDCYQGRGLGTALGEALVEAARTRGIEEFTASILPENLPAQRLFARLSDRMSTHVEHGIYEVVARLSA